MKKALTVLAVVAELGCASQHMDVEAKRAASPEGQQAMELVRAFAQALAEGRVSDALRLDEHFYTEKENLRTRVPAASLAQEVEALEATYIEAVADLADAEVSRHRERGSAYQLVRSGAGVEVRGARSDGTDWIVDVVVSYPSGTLAPMVVDGRRRRPMLSAGMALRVMTLLGSERVLPECRIDGMELRDVPPLTQELAADVLALVPAETWQWRVRVREEGLLSELQGGRMGYRIDRSAIDRAASVYRDHGWIVGPWEEDLTPPLLSAGYEVQRPRGWADLAMEDGTLPLADEVEVSVIGVVQVDTEATVTVTRRPTGLTAVGLFLRDLAKLERQVQTVETPTGSERSHVSFAKAVTTTEELESLDQAEAGGAVEKIRLFWSGARWEVVGPVAS